jgi:hypothetical protein
MRQVWRGMQYRRSQKEIISYLIVLHSVGGLVSTIMHSTLLYTIHYYTLFTVIYRKCLFTYYTGLL